MKTRIENMKMKTSCSLALVLFGLSPLSVWAATHYVALDSPEPTPPYTTWTTAATNIQDAVNVAGAGDEIVVTNGIYAPVSVNRPLTLQSVNGPAVTVINGGGTNTCVYLANSAVMVGFTLTNGFASDYGGGVYCESTNEVLTNCVLTGNSVIGTFGYDGGPYGQGGGAYGGTLNNCTLTGNSAPALWPMGGGAGGGACDSTLNTCTLTGNSSYYGGGAGWSTLNNCTLTSNSAHGGFAKSTDPAVGGGAWSCTLNNCTLTGNSVFGYEDSEGAYAAGIGGGAYDSTLNNCTLTGNSADYGGGAYGGTLNNCTLTGNSAPALWSEVGGAGGGAYDSTLNNCIVYFNNGGNYDSSSTLNYCCTTPLPTNGVGNLSADPQLASAWYLSALSPCIGAGSATYASGTDIDGEPWANPPSIGSEEYHARAVTGPLTVSLTATLTNVVIGYPVGLTAFIEGRTDWSMWEFGDGSVKVNEPYTSHPWTVPGDYRVSLWAYNDSYPAGVSATVTVHVEAGLHYVAANNSNPVAPYTSWATAARNIQDAVDVGLPGATIFVTNGVYAPVIVNTPLTLHSSNGPGVTVINGGGTNNCVYLATNAVLAGFTLANGFTYASGGGVYCASTNAVLTNCVLTGNEALRMGWGGGGSGGGAYGGMLINCTLTGNQVPDGAGGGAADCTLNNCALAGNSVGGGIGGGASFCTLNNCTLTGNGAFQGGGAAGSTLNNCTLTGNSAADDGGGAYGSTLNNCIVYFNMAPDGAGGNYDSSSALNYCCTTPLPGGIGNITNAPLFVNYAGGNLRLQSNSPCINSGYNAYVVGSTDLDGNPRIVGGTVDIGAYEYQTPLSRVSYAWLQHYGLPINTNTDTADPDGTGLNVYQDWIAGLNPTNALSVLQMTSATRTNASAGLVVTWQSVSGILYFLQSSTNLAGQPAFSTIQSNLVGQAGTTCYTDTNAVGVGPYFYRVGVGN
jgi:hypothetical protein